MRVSWVAPEKFSGEELNPIGIRFEIDPEWHIYWVNPGDSGAAPKFDFSESTESNGVRTITPIRWPAPHRLPVAHLTNIGYDNEVVLPFTVLPVSGAKKIKLTAKLEWLVCKEDCIPGFGTLTLERPITIGVSREEEKWKPSDLLKLISYMRRTPLKSEESNFIIPRAINDSTHIVVTVEAKEPKAQLSQPEIFPLDGNFIAAQEPQVETTQNGYRFRMPLVPGATPPTNTGFVLVERIDNKFNAAFEFNNVPVSSGTTDAPESDSLVLLLLFAFLGGVILNLMPCVFPVISLKFFSLIKPENSLRERLHESLMYTSGVLVTFVTLGAILALLRSGGAAIGWGFHLQNPLLIFALILLFWLMALNFWGLFEFGTSLMNTAGRFRWNSSFGVGVLSVFVAAPCTGPFMGVALGATAVLPTLQGLGIFAALGLGLASPFLLLAVSPKLLSLLPKPGLWMDRFKHFMGFPLAGTVIWLLWVLSSQVGDTGWVMAMSALLLIAFAFWTRSKVLRALVALTVLWCGYTIATTKVSSISTSTNSAWAPYDRDAIQKARAENRPVFIDFTAAWCITCQVNKKTVLDTEAAQKLFASQNTYLVRADWTNYDANITAALAELGRNSVPTYVYYPSDGSGAKILPQILTLSIIESLGSQ